MNLLNRHSGSAREGISTPAAEPRHPLDEIRDRSPLDALGRAIASPVIESARGVDPNLPAATAGDHPPADAAHGQARS